MADQPPLSPTDGIIPRDDAKVQRQSDLASVLTSAILHMIALVILALCVVPSLSFGTKRLLEFSVSENQVAPMESIPIETDFVPPMAADESVATTRSVLSELLPELSLADVPLVSNGGITPTSFVPPISLGEALTKSTSVEGAVDRITAELNAKLEKGDLLVVWMLDSSHSLVDDRKRVAARLTPFYNELISGKHSSGHQLMSAVVSYGRNMNERVAPTNFGEAIVSAIEDLPIDRTGNERVFDAVGKSVLHYRSSWRDKQLAVVIWTDESGDDVIRLEDTIELCQRNAASVSVVGPSSVLGADTGFHSYVDPKSQSTYQLPVRRGPDTAMPERIELGYWYITSYGVGRYGGRRRGGFRRRVTLPSWIGGQDLAGILSGFSPYALTRLSMQTGGTYTIFDREDDRGPFELATMLPYAPSYGSQDEYESEVRAGPLRVAVMNAVKVLEGKKVDAPPTMFFIKSTGPRFFDFVTFYYTPVQFRSKLRSASSRLKSQARRNAKLIEAALLKVSENGDPEYGLQNPYAGESSPRWRAWYDLTRGRLLATSVRLEEYRLTIDAITKGGGLASDTNFVMLVASKELRSGEQFQRRAEEAEQLLRRCIEENPGTPWEFLALRELDYFFGVGVKERALTPEPFAPLPKQPNLPRF